MLHVSGFAKEGWRIAAMALALAGAIAVTGCGKKTEAQAVVGQVIAHVGPDDVTQQEVDNELRIANVPADKRSDAILKAALSRVIERKYLAQQAIAARAPIQAADLIVREVPADATNAEGTFADPAQVLGLIATVPILQGQPVYATCSRTWCSRFRRARSAWCAATLAAASVRRAGNMSSIG